MRKKVIAANWKMYKTPDETFAFMQAFLREISGHNRDEIVLCPPFVDIATAVQAARHSNVQIGAQNMFWEMEGAFTGEVSARMILAAGCSHVIIGPSERRQYFGETDDTVNRKLLAALDAGIVPIVCVGEVLQERESGLTEEILRRQVTGAFRTISGDKAAPIIVAYEPVWAIGTGKTATPAIAADAHHVIRAEAAKAFGQAAAENMRILYGGSVKPDNARALMSQSEIDGALVGGASLDPKSFTAIVKY
jgi:triosephosphate isomerase (TIM)